MAILTTIHCRKWSRSRMITCSINRIPGICHECAAEEARKEEDDFIRKFVSLPKDAAIELLAKEIYALKKRPAYDDRIIG